MLYSYRLKAAVGLLVYHGSCVRLTTFALPVVLQGQQRARSPDKRISLPTRLEQEGAHATTVRGLVHLLHNTVGYIFDMENYSSKNIGDCGDQKAPDTFGSLYSVLVKCFGASMSTVEKEHYCFPENIYQPNDASH